MDVYCPRAAETGCLIPTLLEAEIAALADLFPTEVDNIAERLILSVHCRGCAHDVQLGRDADILPCDWPLDED